MNEFRILLLCSSRLALPCLHQLIYSNMLAAVIVPAHCDELAENVQYVLQNTVIPLVIVQKDNYTHVLMTAIEKHQVTLGLMVTFPFLIPAAVYKLPKQGFYNVHPGPLPQYRGADPVFQQIKNREKQAGITVHLLSEKFDTGPVIMQEMIRLKSTDTYGLLTSKLGENAARMLLTLVKLINLNIQMPQRQQDENKTRYFKKHLAVDVAINWQQMDGAAIIALINACNPWNKGATTQLNGKIVRLLEAQLVPPHHLPVNLPPPGIILVFQDTDMIVAASNNTAIRVRVFYMEEGFFQAVRLQEMGIVAGMQFQNLF